MSKIHYLRFFNIEPEYKVKVLAFYAYPSVRQRIARIGAVLSVTSLISFAIALIIGFASFSLFESVILVLFTGWFGAFVFFPFCIRMFIIPIASWSLPQWWVREIAIFYESFAYAGFILGCLSASLVPWGLINY